MLLPGLPSQATWDVWVYLLGIILFGSIFLGFQIQPTIGGLMGKPPSSRVRTRWPLFPVSLEVRPKIRGLSRESSDSVPRCCQLESRRGATGCVFAKMLTVYSAWLGCWSLTIHTRRTRPTRDLVTVRKAKFLRCTVVLFPEVNIPPHQSFLVVAHTASR